MTNYSKLISVVLGFSFSAVSLQATPLFQVTVRSVGEDPIIKTREASSLPDLLEVFLNQKDEFAIFENEDWVADLTYLGLPEAFQVTADKDGTDVVIESDLTGLEVDFTGADRDAVADDVEEWFEDEGAAAVSEVEAEVAKVSALAITDGNPLATTARLANRAFRAFGFYNSTAAYLGSEDGEFAINIGAHFDFSSFSVDAPSGTADGDQFAITLPFQVDLPWKNIVIKGVGSFEITDMEGTEIYGGGYQVGVPIEIVEDYKDLGISWTLSPNLGLEGRGAYDVATGGLLVQYGLTSRVDYVVNEKLVIASINQLSTYSTIPIIVGDLRLDPDVNQVIFKNGILASYLFYPAFTVDAFLINTAFLEDAAVDNYNTLGIDAYLKVTGSFNVSVSLDYTLADDFDDTRLGFAASCKF